MIIKTQALIDISMVINCNNMSETKHLIALTFATWAAKQTRCVRNVYLVTLHMSICGREGVRTGLMERLNLALAPYEGPEGGKMSRPYNSQWLSASQPWVGSVCSVAWGNFWNWLTGQGGV